ncbi:hypothetical protein D3C81_1698710 [compost metagenome]
MPPDYLEQKINNAHAELNIITDNIQLLKPHHIRALISINAMVGNIINWNAIDVEDQAAKENPDAGH